jgi:hypothetical protein
MPSIKQELLASIHGENSLRSRPLFNTEVIQKARLPKNLAQAALNLANLSPTPEDLKIADQIETKYRIGKPLSVAEELVMVLNRREPGF